MTCGWSRQRRIFSSDLRSSQGFKEFHRGKVAATKGKVQYKLQPQVFWVKPLSGLGFKGDHSIKHIPRIPAAPKHCNSENHEKQNTLRLIAIQFEQHPRQGTCSLYGHSSRRLNATNAQNYISTCSRPENLNYARRREPNVLHLAASFQDF